MLSRLRINCNIINIPFFVKKKRWANFFRLFIMLGAYSWFLFLLPLFWVNDDFLMDRIGAPAGQKNSLVGRLLLIPKEG